MKIPLLRLNTSLLRALPSYILAGALKQTKYYLDIGRVDQPYVWFIRYYNGDIGAVYCIVHDRSLRRAAFKMLIRLKEHEIKCKEY